MATEIKVPTLGESVTSATVARWMKQAGEAVAADEPVVELETDKVTLEVNAPAAGVLNITVQEGAEVEPGAVLGEIDPAGAAAAPRTPELAAAGSAALPAPGVNPPPVSRGPVSRPATPPADVVQLGGSQAAAHAPFPAAAKIMEEQRLSPAQLGAGTGKDGRITKGDVLAFLSRPQPRAPPPPRLRGRRANPTCARSG